MDPVWLADIAQTIGSAFVMAGVGAFVAEFGAVALIGAILAMALGGFGKGVVGFALPMIALSTMGSFLPGEIAIALLIVPTFVANMVQSLRNGIGEALGSLRKFWRLNLILVPTMALCAQLVVALSDRALFMILGISISAFATSQLAGWSPRIAPRHKNVAEVATALGAGFFGGLAGIWGPPLVLYLLATGIRKVEMVRVQSVSFVIGSVILVAAHLQTGVLNSMTVPVSIWLVIPTMASMALGFRVQDKLDQAIFRKVTLAVLALAGLNLLRRALMV